MPFNNQTKNTTSFTNKSIGNGITWDGYNVSWDDSDPATWDNPGTPFDNKTKATTNFTNETKS